MAVAHFAKARQVFVGRAAAKRAVGAGGVEVTPVGAHGVGALLVDIGQARDDQRLGGAVHEVEVVARVVQVGAHGRRMQRIRRFPAEAQPRHRIEDGIDVFLLFLFGVGVIEAHVAHAAVIARQPEVQADALGVADVQVAIGFGRKPRADASRIHRSHGVVSRIARRAGKGAPGVGARRQIALDHLSQEIARLGVVGRVLWGGFGHGWARCKRSANTSV